MLKTTNSYLLVGLLAASYLAGWFGYKDEREIKLPIFFALYARYNEKDLLIAAHKELAALNEEKDGELEEAEGLQYSIELKQREMTALKSKTVAITSSILYTTLKQHALEVILDYSMENSKSYMQMVAAPFALAFFCAFMEKKFIDRYQYKTSDDLNDDCGTYRNNALILCYSLLQAATLASCNLAAHILMKNYGENISSGIKTVIPIPSVRNFIANIITMPRVCGSIFERLANRALRRSGYTHEIDIDLPQMGR